MHFRCPYSIRARTVDTAVVGGFRDVYVLYSAIVIKVFGMVFGGCDAESPSRVRKLLYGKVSRSRIRPTVLRVSGIPTRPCTACSERTNVSERTSVLLCRYVCSKQDANTYVQPLVDSLL